jgi:hypothetical protein
MKRHIEGEKCAIELLKAWSNDIDLNSEVSTACLENGISNEPELSFTISFCFLYSDVIEAIYEIKKIQMPIFPSGILALQS